MNRCESTMVHGQEFLPPTSLGAHEEEQEDQNAAAHDAESASLRVTLDPGRLKTPKQWQADHVNDAS